PTAILCISAHWYTSGTFVTTNETQRTIHDFGGFPDELYAQRYDTPGAPELAEELIEKTGVTGATDWGLDHGAWSVLKPMFPDGDIPVFQLSIDFKKKPEFHYEMGRELGYLRSKGVLIVGSGNVVHNLRLARWDGGDAFEWAEEFGEYARRNLNERNDTPLIDYHHAGQSADLSVPTNEHYLPLLYALGASAGRSEIEIFNDDFDMGSIAMMSAIIR
ncbi:MAG TPA: 4,5-DOPA dioxygenase extradiol, partial [Pyrinomonadaceae bacterium]|nr:4,5-DOPA dioxygenase extradiol [Pyrinomonadaceae bacterium]